VRKKLLLSGMVLFVMLCSSLIVSVDAASMWNLTYGGTGSEMAYSLVATSDGGYAIAGSTLANTPIDYYLNDFHLVKIDTLGNMQWNKTYGETMSETAYSLVVASDGGYALAGTTHHGENYRDFWLVKTDPSGNMEWNRTYGETPDNGALSLIVTSDGGYALAGWTDALGTEGYDFLLVKTDAFGNMEWNKTYLFGEAKSLVATSDGGYAIAGTANASDGGSRDFYLARTDSLGNMQWNHTYGGAGDDLARSLVATSDGGYAVAGTRDYYSPILYSHAYPSLVETDAFGNIHGNKTLALADAAESPGSGSNDIWLVKTDSNGVMQWNKTYGEGQANSLVATSDGGYAIAGYTKSSGGYYCWLVKTDALGNMEWIKYYEEGYGYWMQAMSLVASNDGGYALAGYIFHYLLYNSNYDFWLVKTDEFGVVPEYSSLLVPALVLTSTAFLIIKAERKRRRALSAH